MDDENASCAHDGEECAQLSLLNLPEEMFLHLCTFLDASTLVHGLNLTRKQFYEILNDDNLLWKARLDCILPNGSRSLLCPERPWKLPGVAIKEQIALWKQQDSMEKLEFPKGYSALSVLLMPVDGITYLVGTQPCKLFYVKLSYPVEFFDKVNVFDAMGPHRLRSCSLAINNTVYNCCNNNTVKSWVLTDTDGLVSYRTYEIKCKKTDGLRCIATDVSSCPEQARFAIGSVDGAIYVYDSRSSSNEPISQYQSIDEVVLTSLAMNAEYILSASLDGTVYIWNQKTEQIMNKFTIPGNPVPWCISMQWNWVCIGDEKAKLHMLNLNNNNLNLNNNDIKLDSYSIRDTNITSYANIIALAGVCLTRGCLITSSYDGTVRISTPSNPPRSIATLVHRSQINSMDYLNDTLAIAGPILVVWRPINRRV